MKNNRTIWIIVVVVFLVLCCCCAATAMVLVAGGVNWGGSWIWGSRAQATDRFTRTLVAEEPLSLSLDTPIGDITVKASTGQQVEIEAIKRAWGRSRSQAEEILQGIDIQVEQAGAQVRIAVHGMEGLRGLPRSPEIDMVISVPQQTALNVNSNVGRLSVTGTRGDVVVKSDVGEVVLLDVFPNENLEVETRVANVELTGALVPGATYRLTSDVGRIAVRVPQDSAFSIDARSDIGDVRVGFDLAGRSSREGFVGKEVQGTVSANPTAELYLRSRVGDISVQPAR